MQNNKEIALLPVDNRPVSYLLPKQIGEFAGIDLNLPDRHKLGDLQNSSDLTYIDGWINSLNSDSCLILSLDNWVYGGLVQSRKHSSSLEELKKRVSGLLKINKFAKYGFGSIMRIPDYNNSDEEKDYWEKYGEKIHKWSKLTHLVGTGIKEEYKTHDDLIETWYQSTKKIPVEILTSYKSHRDINFSINMLWLDSLHKKSFNYLIFSSDDSSKYGLNVVESEYLDKEIKKHHFESIAKVISGTDEIPLVLLTKAQIEITKLKPKISINFTDIDGANQIARYESNTIKFSVLNQLEVLNIEITEPDKSDISLIVHLSGSGQGDHIFNIKPGDTKKSAEKIINFLKTSEKPFIITDLAHANGADPILINSLINSEINWDQCYGYSGWNTCSNTIGSALSIGINRWIAEKKNIFNKTAFKKCLITRFLDDYAYQTEIRGLKKSEKEINDLMKEYVQKFSTMLGLDNISTECSLPWKRSFEIEIEFINVI